MPTLLQRDISVIVPVFNLEKYIQPMLDCLKRQDLGDYTAEFIFVLNNCTDKSEEVIRANGFDQIYNCTEQGCGCARNTGYEESCGKYIWFMDGDDWLLSKTAIKDVLDAIDGPILRVPYTSNLYTGQYFSMVWQYVFSRELIDDLRFRKIQPGEDDAFMLEVFERIGLNAETYLSMPTYGQPLYYYNYLRPGSNMERHMKGEDINIAPRS